MNMSSPLALVLYRHIEIFTMSAIMIGVKLKCLSHIASPNIRAGSSQDVFLNRKLLTVHHQQCIMEALLLPERAKNSEEVLAMLRVKYL